LPLGESMVLPGSWRCIPSEWIASRTLASELKTGLPD
jgi:hypothetical protein